MKIAKLRTAGLFVIPVMACGCATTLYDTLLEGADRIIAVHTAKDTPRIPSSKSGESVRVTSSMMETNGGAAPSATAHVDERAYRARTAGFDVRQHTSASIADSGGAQDGGSQNDPWALIRIERAKKSLPANASQGYAAQYTAAQALDSAQDKQEANSQKQLEAIDSLMMARSQRETSNVSAPTANAPASESTSELPSNAFLGAQLERELWAVYRAFDFERVERIARQIAGLPSVTLRQAATAWFLAGAAAYLRGDMESARTLFRQAVQTDRLLRPDATVFPDHMLEFYKKSTATADSQSR